MIDLILKNKELSMNEQEIKYGLNEEEMDHVCCCYCGGSNIQVIRKIVYALDVTGEIDYDNELYITNKYSDPYCVDCAIATEIITKKEFVDKVSEYKTGRYNTNFDGFMVEDDWDFEDNIDGINYDEYKEF